LSVGTESASLSIASVAILRQSGFLPNSGDVQDFALDDGCV
jgi:hypothetical protein